MTRKLFESLADPPAADDPWVDESEQVPPLLRALAQAGAQQRAAQELADEEFHQGFWVESEEVPAAEVWRLAAQDRPSHTMYSAGPWRVRIGRTDDTLQATQEAGPNGATLVIGSPAAAVYIALEPGVGAVLPHISPLPDTLTLLEPGGRRVVLKAEVSEAD